MTLTLSMGPLIALLAGILILVMPRLLNYIVAIYLIIVGLTGLNAVTSMRNRPMAPSRHHRLAKQPAKITNSEAKTTVRRQSHRPPDSLRRQDPTRSVKP